MSASDQRVHFGLNAKPNLEGVVVEWPNGEREVWTDIRLRTLVTLRQNSGKPWPIVPQSRR